MALEERSIVDVDSSVDNRHWTEEFDTSSGISTMARKLVSDDGQTKTAYETVTRSGTTVTSIDFRNAGKVIFAQAGLSYLDSSGSYYRTITTTDTLTANRTLTLVLGNANRTLTMTADSTIGAGSTTGTNTGDVTLTGENYLSIASQTITVAAVNLSGTHVTGTLAAGRFPALTGDVTTTAGSLATSIAALAVTNAMIANTTIDLTAKVTGVLPIANGGSAKALTLAAGAVIWCDANSFEVTAAGSSGQVLQSGGTATPTWTTATYPATAGSAGKILRSDGTNWVGSTPTFSVTATSGTYLRGDGTNWITSTLILPNAATANRVVVATSANTYGESANLTFDGSTLVLTGAATISTTLGVTGNTTLSGTGTTIAHGSWTTMTGSYSNSWVDYGGSFQVGRYMKDPFGFVHVEGTLKNGTLDAACFTLPAGYRPAADAYYVSTGGGAVGGIIVSSAGVITLYGTSNASFSIYITFRAS